MNPSSKVTPAHQERTAVVYIRQSSLRQVEENLESQDLQYQLVQRAGALGWPAANIQVIDDDLGKSAITSANREGFQSLVASVGLGQVGILLVTDVSRLARNCADWYRLLDLTSLCGTLISDASGIYDPRIYDDRLLLGLKGTFSEAQWYSLRTQLGAAKLNKAKRGQLHTRLPVGLVRLGEERIAFHPDQQVQSVIRLVFSEFERLGSAHKLLRVFRDQSLQLPRRVGSSYADEIRWVRPSFAAIYAILKNPAYAGTYAYGKLHRTRLPGDAHKVVVHPLPQADWPVLLPNAFPGFISWEQYQLNQARLALNAQGIHWKRGAPRPGLALLQGIAICARCGRLLHVHYTHAPAYVCNHATQQYGDRRCQTLTLAYVDPFVAQLFLDALQPAHLEAALAALDQLDAHRQTLALQWRQRLERARYETGLARRRYERVDPDLRLVAAELELDWNEKLRQQAQLEKDCTQAQSRQLQPLGDRERKLIRSLAADLPALWQSASPADRKRLLRCLIADVTLDAFSSPACIRIFVRWHTGATSTLEVPRPRHGTPPATAVANRIRPLALSLPDDLIAETLNAQGFPTATGLPWTTDRIRAVRRKHNIPTACPLGAAKPGPRGDGLLKSAEVARRLGVHPCMISSWFQQGLLSGHQRIPGGWLWIRLNDDDLSRLDGSANLSPEMIPFGDSPRLLGQSPDQIRDMIRAGRFRPYRLRTNQSAWTWFLLPQPDSSNPISSAQ
jgi:DNA invertase Pin-like site-specific DNA recombinase